MARMIPDSLTEATESAAERRVFERLRDSTDDQLVAFHSVAWLVPARGRPRQGEADFVLAHPEFGALALEVKGGGIRYDAATHKWYSAGQAGEVVIKDPARQAQNAMHRLRDLIARSARGDVAVPFGAGVCFPDTRVDERSLRTDLPREIVIDNRDLRRLAARLDALFRYWYDAEHDRPLGAEGIQRLERLLANSFQLRAPLGYEYEDEERELLRLTEEQFRVLDMLARHTRVAIAGCAGSGKTFLAAEKARRLAEQGFRVYLFASTVFLPSTCVVAWLTSRPSTRSRTTHSRSRSCMRLGSTCQPSRLKRTRANTWRSLRQAFADCVDIAAGRYGALVVDEAQDFQEDWWLPLQLMLEDPDRSPLYVFFDDNQRIFAAPKNLPISGEPVELTINCRNTKAINKLVTAFYAGGTIEALGPEGPPIDRHFYATDRELLEQLDASVRMWIEQAEVRPDDIALLTAKSAGRSALWTVDSLGGVRLTEDPWEGGRILRSSIHRFKGLERLVVAVTELDGARSDVFYVGFSRPNVFLSVFCPESARHRLPRELVA
jgi:hypothetical protein